MASFADDEPIVPPFFITKSSTSVTTPSDAIVIAFVVEEEPILPPSDILRPVVLKIPELELKVKFVPVFRAWLPVAEFAKIIKFSVSELSSVRLISSAIFPPS